MSSAARIQQERRQAVRYVRSFAEAAEIACGEAQEGDMILTLGAGSVSQLGPVILERLQQRVAVGSA